MEAPHVGAAADTGAERDGEQATQGDHGGQIEQLEQLFITHVPRSLAPCGSGAHWLMQFTALFGSQPLVFSHWSTQLMNVLHVPSAAQVLCWVQQWLSAQAWHDAKDGARPHPEPLSAPELLPPLLLLVPEPPLEEPLPLPPPELLELEPPLLPDPPPDALPELPPEPPSSPPSRPGFVPPSEEVRSWNPHTLAHATAAMLTGRISPRASRERAVRIVTAGHRSGMT